MVPGARFASFAPRNSQSQLRHDIHFGTMYEFSVPQPIALFAYGHIGPNGAYVAVSDSSQASDVDWTYFQQHTGLFFRSNCPDSATG
jgi:hypothetical protein